MAAQPKRKISTYRKGKRFATKKRTVASLVVCKHCGQKKKAHYLCPNCKK